MPELPDLEVVKKILRQKIYQARITQVDIKSPATVKKPSARQLVVEIEGSTITGIDRRGKMLIFHLSNGKKIVLHMMLYGRLQYCPATPPLTKDNLIIFNFDGYQLRFNDTRRMAKLYCVDDLDQVEEIRKMGPEPLAEGFTLDTLQRILKKQKTKIKALLMDQSKIAGIGNAYADEILFAAGIHPNKTTLSLSIDEQQRLFNAMREVLTCSMEEIARHIGDQIEIEYRDHLKVHGRAGEPCPRCETTIAEIKVEGRGTAFCPSCQK